MEKLNYEVLRKSGYDGYILENAPEKVLQFGEGNFLRAFVNYWFDVSNEKAGWNGKCVLVQPIAQGLTELINAQQGLYTLYLRGRENGERVDRKRVISCVSRAINPYAEGGYDAVMELAKSPDLEYVVSNTTEAGIVYDPACQKDDKPASSFPAKLTQVLLTRFEAGQSGLVILSCELIDNNGKELLKCVNQYIDQWGLSDAFRKYVNEDCTFWWTASSPAASATPRRWRSWRPSTATAIPCWTWARSSACGTSRVPRGWRTSCPSRRPGSTASWCPM